MLIADHNDWEFRLTQVPSGVLARLLITTVALFRVVYNPIVWRGQQALITGAIFGNWQKRRLETATAGCRCRRPVCLPSQFR